MLVTAMPTTTHYVSPEWHKTPEGKEILSSILNKTNQKRRSFGLLEHPILPSKYDLDTYTYKVFVSGKSGVGKTSTVAKLSGNSVPNTHNETPGIQTSVLYWPAKILDTNKTVMFKLHLWDAGENALKKFDHIQPACRDHMDGVLLMFSFVDKSSFDDVPQQMSRILEPSENVCKFVLGTKLDMHSHSEITQHDIREFESHWKLRIFSIRNTPDANLADDVSDLEEMAPLLNFICDNLWRRDQEHMLESTSIGGGSEFNYQRSFHC